MTDEIVPPPSRTKGKQLEFFFACIVLGPPVGLLVAVAIGFLTNGLPVPPPGADPVDAVRLAGALVFIVTISYLIGFVPAMLHAVTMNSLGGLHMSKAVYVIASAASGYVWTLGLGFGMTTLLASGSLDRQDVSWTWWRDALPLGLIGLVPAIIIALVPALDVRRPAQPD